jgi:hypothetical protein
MRTLWRALGIGACAVLILIVIEASFAVIDVLRPVGQAIALLLYPGTALVIVTGNHRLDDLGFWSLALAINWIIYSSIAFTVLLLAQRQRGARPGFGPRSQF